MTNNTDTVRALIEVIRQRFTSGNSVPIERAHITAKEWSVLEAALASAPTGATAGVDWIMELADEYDAKGQHERAYYLRIKAAIAAREAAQPATPTPSERCLVSATRWKPGGAKSLSEPSDWRKRFGNWLTCSASPACTTMRFLPRHTPNWDKRTSNEIRIQDARRI